MNKEYFLIGFRTTTGKRGYKLIDRFVCKSIKEAEKEFKRRNNFQRILEKYNLIISKAERWFN